MTKTMTLAIILAAGGLADPALAQISYVGSSTIGENILPQAAKAFTAKSGVPFGAIDVMGSGKGLEKVLRGEAQLAGVSRALSGAEKRQRIYYQIIGYDAVAVFVHPDNPVASLSKPQLKGIYTGRIRRWSEVGGPDAPIVVITQMVKGGRGQVVEFQEHAMDGAPYREDRREVDHRDDQVTTLVAERYGITAVSLVSARPGIKPVAIEGFTPDPATVRSGAYILSRPLILVAPAPPRSDVKRFVDFMLSPEGQAIVAQKFVPVH